MDKEKIAFWAFVFGVLGFIGGLFMGNGFGELVATLLIMAPYVYLQFREGYSTTTQGSASSSANTSNSSNPLGNENGSNLYSSSKAYKATVLIVAILVVLVLWAAF